MVNASRGSDVGLQQTRGVGALGVDENNIITAIIMVTAMAKLWGVKRFIIY